jgi:hypothetical protein
LARRNSTGQPSGDCVFCRWIHRKLIGKKVSEKNAHIVAVSADGDAGVYTGKSCSVAIPPARLFFKLCVEIVIQSPRWRSVNSSPLGDG